MPTNPLRMLPSVGDLLEHPQLKKLRDKVSHSVIVSRARGILDELKHEVQAAAAEVRLPSPTELAERIARRILQSNEPCLRPVINATGVLLHPRLGRAPLAEEAILEIAAVGRDYSSLDLEQPSGKSPPREAAVAGLLQELTSAESACVVNNQAAAVLLVLAALAKGRKAVVSRGELLEAADHFRLADVAATAGAGLCEVGATNRTRLEDYRQAIDGQAVDGQAALLWQSDAHGHAAGTAEGVAQAELVRLGQEMQIPVVRHLELGALLDPAELGLAGLSSTAHSVRTRADLVILPGDKLLGGPACGIVLGRRELIERLTRHPLARALRADKLTLAALAATLRLYRTPDVARREIPILALLDTPVDNLKGRAQRLAPQLAALPAIDTAEAVPGQACLEDPAMPGQQVPTWCVALRPARQDSGRLAKLLQAGVPSVVGRVEQDRLLLDLRTVFPRQDQQLIEAIAAIEPAASA
ncbi:MAG: L-seryl-tRNA(Sec) selenium transferase [Pirellulales bacterium]